MMVSKNRYYRSDRLWMKRVAMGRRVVRPTRPLLLPKIPMVRMSPLLNIIMIISDGSSLYGAVPSPSSYISSPQEPFSANEEFSSSHVAEKMKAGREELPVYLVDLNPFSGPNTGNYDTSMGLNELEQKKAQLVARANQRK